MFEFVEEALDVIALLVERLIERPQLLSIRPRLDAGLSPELYDRLVEVLGVVGGVSKDRPWSQAFDKFCGSQNLALLSWTADQPRRIAEGVGRGVDLGAQAATGAAQALGIRPPFSLRAPAACW